jgi:hypothetical protein
MWFVFTKASFSGTTIDDEFRGNETKYETPFAID